MEQVRLISSCVNYARNLFVSRCWLYTPDSC